jgi:hypothetical protein
MSETNGDPGYTGGCLGAMGAMGGMIAKIILGALAVLIVLYAGWIVLEESFGGDYAYEIAPPTPTVAPKAISATTDAGVGDAAGMVMGMAALLALFGIVLVVAFIPLSRMVSID